MKKKITRRHPARPAKKLSTLWIIAIVGIIIIGIALASGALKFDFQVKGVSSTAPSIANWQTYVDKDIGYTLKHPKGWIVQNIPATDKRELIVKHPQGLAFVAITGLKDPGLTDLTYMKNSIAEFKAKLENDPTILQLAQFKSDIKGNLGAFIAIGEEKREGKNWYFEQRGIMSTKGRILLFHGAAQSKVYKDYKTIISQIIENFKDSAE